MILNSSSPKEDLIKVYAEIFNESFKKLVQNYWANNYQTMDVSIKINI